LSVSPLTIDPIMQDQVKELHEVIHLFNQATTNPISDCVLPTPQHKYVMPVDQTHGAEQEATTTRKSPRIKNKGNSRKIHSEACTRVSG
jgi:hypothetical protein